MRKGGQARAPAAAPPAPHNQQQPAQPKSQGERQAAEAGGGGKASKRRKRLLPGAPLSTEMQAALGEIDAEGALLRHKVAQRQHGATAPGGGAGAKRSRRQTQFYRL